MKISFKFLPLEEFTVHGPRITQNLPYMVQDSHRIYFTWSKIHTEFTLHGPRFTQNLPFQQILLTLDTLDLHDYLDESVSSGRT